MNYVAHLFLARPTDEHRIGSLLADFTVGKIESLRERYGEGIAAGILHHREVDRFTDTHPEVGRAMDALQEGYGLYASIMVDVVFDHFLLEHWQRFASLGMDEFFDEVYRSLAREDWEFPPRYSFVVQRMLEKRWLASYRHLDNVAFALRRVGERFNRPTPLDNALPGLHAQYRTLESCFLTFFPELMIFSVAYLESTPVPRRKGVSPRHPLSSGR